MRRGRRVRARSMLCEGDPPMRRVTSRLLRRMPRPGLAGIALAAALLLVAVPPVALAGATIPVRVELGDRCVTAHAPAGRVKIRVSWNGHARSVSVTAAGGQATGGVGH